MTSFVLLILLTSELPHIDQPSFVPLMGTIGFFVGGLLAYLNGAAREHRSQWTGTGTWWGIGIGGVVWLVVLAIHRL